MFTSCSFWLLSCSAAPRIYLALIASTWLPKSSWIFYITDPFANLRFLVSSTNLSSMLFNCFTVSSVALISAELSWFLWASVSFSCYLTFWSSLSVSCNLASSSIFSISSWSIWSLFESLLLFSILRPSGFCSFLICSYTNSILIFSNCSCNSWILLSCFAALSSNFSLSFCCYNCAAKDSSFWILLSCSSFSASSFATLILEFRSFISYFRFASAFWSPMLSCVRVCNCFFSYSTSEALCFKEVDVTFSFSL